MTFKCHCGATIEYPATGGYNVGHAVETTGWNYIMLTDGGSAWACPECTDKLEAAAKEIERLLGEKVTDYLHFPCVLKPLNKRIKAEKMAMDPSKCKVGDRVVMWMTGCVAKFVATCVSTKDEPDGRPEYDQPQFEITHIIQGKELIEDTSTIKRMKPGDYILLEPYKDDRASEENL